MVDWNIFQSSLSNYAVPTPISIFFRIWKDEESILEWGRPTPLIYISLRPHIGNAEKGHDRPPWRRDTASKNGRWRRRRRVSLLLPRLSDLLRTHEYTHLKSWKRLQPRLQWQNNGSILHALSAAGFYLFSARIILFFPKKRVTGPNVSWF